MFWLLYVVVVFVVLTVVDCQVYDVTDISCNLQNKERLSAKLRKPEGFQAVPIFADDRQTNPLQSLYCQIRPDITDNSGLSYDLLVTDFSKCGTIVRNGFINVRVWFPKLPGIVMMSDQEVIIMCKPPENNPSPPVEYTIPREKNNLDYLVSVYREVEGTDTLSSNQAVPIGTRLQLRASINTKSAWTTLKLLEVSLSPSPRDPYAPGHVLLIRDGCRVAEFSTIVPENPKLNKNISGQVDVEFEAVMLDANRDKTSRVWVHARSKACRSSRGCEPSDCGGMKGRGRRETDRRRRESGARTDKLLSRDLVVGRELVVVSDGVYLKKDPATGLGLLLPIGDRASRLETLQEIETELGDIQQQIQSGENDDEDKEETDFTDNVGLTVIRSQDEYYSPHNSRGNGNMKNQQIKEAHQDCNTFLAVGVAMGCLLIIASIMMCYLAQKLHRTVHETSSSKSENILRDHRRQMGLEPGGGGLYRSTA